MAASWLIAFAWGTGTGAALLLGALLGFHLSISQRVIAGIMAFGSGVLISALSFDLMDEAHRHGGLTYAALGFFGGAFVYTVLNVLLTRYGAKHRKRSGSFQTSEQDQEGSGLAIALGALLDGIPESIVIGMSLLGGRGVSLVTVCAVFISNIPEGLSSAAGMKKAGRSAGYVFGVWGAIMFISGLAAFAGNAFLGHIGSESVAAITAAAGGAILAMLVDTMIPEAFHEAHELAGLITVSGFLASFALTKLQ